MGTKNNPGKYDCFGDAEPDEPMFVLLGRDPTASIVVGFWRALKDEMVAEGTSASSPEKLREADVCVSAMERWARGKGKNVEAALRVAARYFTSAGGKRAENLRIAYLEAGIRSLLEHHATTAAEEQTQIDGEFKDDGKLKSEDKIRERLIGKVKLRRAVTARLQNLLDGHLLVPEAELMVAEYQQVPLPAPRKMGKCDCCYSPGDPDVPLNFTRYNDGATEREEQLCDACEKRPF